MRHRRFARYAVAAPPPDPDPNPGQATFPLGINFDEFVYYYRVPIYRDLVRVGSGFNTPGLSTYVAIDAQGWPTGDFRLGLQNLDDTGVVDEIQVQFTGRLLNGSADLTITADGNAYSLKPASWNYNSTTNTTQFTLNVAATGRANNFFVFNNTRRTSASTGRDGLTDIKAARPGYTIGDLAVSKYTNEIKTALTPFNILRFTQPLRAWSNTDITTWDQRPTIETTRTSACYKAATPTSDYGMPLDELIELCNETNSSLYLNSYFNADATYIANQAQQVNSLLASGLKCYWEWTNEVWGNQMMVFQLLYDRVSDECDGLWPDGIYRNSPFGMATNGARTGGTLVVTSKQPHRYLTGQTVYTSGFASGVADGANVVTKINATQFSLPSTGTDNAAVLISGTVIGRLDTTLRLGATLVADSEVQIFALGNRYKMRRTKEISDQVRAVVGDANMGTRFNIVLADQMDGNPGGPEWAYFAAKWTARPVNQYFHFHAGAPYTNAEPYWTVESATVDDLVGAWQANLGTAQATYAYERRAQLDRKYGVKSMTYEYALDAVWTGGSATAKQRRIDASFDTRLTTNIKTDMRNFYGSGGDALIWYAAKTSSLGANDAYGCFSTWRSLTDTTSAKIAAINGFIAEGTPVKGRHVSPVTMDGRAYGDSYPPYSGDFPNVSNSAINYKSDTREAQRTYSLRSTAGSHDITITYSCTYASDKFAIYVNNVKAGADVTGPSTGDHLTTTTVVRTVTLVAGMNDIKVVAVAGQGDSYRFHSVQVT